MGTIAASESTGLSSKASFSGSAEVVASSGDMNVDEKTRETHDTAGLPDPSSVLRYRAMIRIPVIECPIVRYGVLRSSCRHEVLSTSKDSWLIRFHLSVIIWRLE